MRGGPSEAICTAVGVAMPCGRHAEGVADHEASWSAARRGDAKKRDCSWKETQQLQKEAGCRC